jgi:hypothetical protein
MPRNQRFKPSRTAKPLEQNDREGTLPIRIAEIERDTDTPARNEDIERAGKAPARDDGTVIEPVP